MRYSISRCSLFTCSLCLLFSFGANAGQHNDDFSLDHSTSVAGEDNNNNGVRDDVENYIASLSDSRAQQNALRQTSAAISAAIAVGNDANASDAQLRAVTQQLSRAIKCLWSRYDSNAAAKEHSDLIRKITANTPERFNAYMQYNAAIDGFAIKLPRGDTCDG